VPDDPDPVDADVDVEFCEPVDPELFDDDVCVAVEPPPPWLDPVDPVVVFDDVPVVFDEV
jgi:hypothetical protein